MKNLQHYYNRVNKWNDRAGVKNHPYGTIEWSRAIQLQSKLLVEEAQETLEAANLEDSVELVDGACDVLVIAFKLIEMLETAGFNVEGAMEAVCSNNDKKIFNSYTEASIQKDLLEDRDQTGYSIETAIENDNPYYTIRRHDGKIAKPVNFEAVDLSKFIPKEV